MPKVDYDKPKKLHEHFCDLVRGTMRRQKVSQTELAEYLGLTYSSISLRLNGYQDWKLLEVFKTMEYLELKGEDVFCLREYSAGKTD